MKSDIRRGFLKGFNIDNSIKTLINKKPLIAKINENRAGVLKSAVEKKINQIPLVDDKGRVKEILLIDESTKDKIKLNHVVIMAGGKGARLSPLTKKIPKPMLKIGNKPILETIISGFKNCGYKNFILCVNYKSNKIKSYFKDGKKFGVNIKYIKEKKKMGTVGALSLIKEKLSEPFFVTNGDLLTNLDFEKMMDFHQKCNATATMGVKEYNLISPYGEVHLLNENIIEINEKPKHRFFANSGIYVLDPECIGLVPKKFYDITTLFNKIISRKKKVISFPIDEYWKDIGKPSDYETAKKEFLKKFKN
jgi:NDP-sugar pyrophosphorylase family protein